MSAIQAVDFNRVEKPQDLARILRWIIADVCAPRTSVEFEPVGRYEGTGIPLDGVPMFIMTPSSSSGFRIDVSEDGGARNELYDLIDRIGAHKALPMLRAAFEPQQEEQTDDETEEQEQEVPAGVQADDAAKS